jgi:hypothetical protein
MKSYLNVFSRAGIGIFGVIFAIAGIALIAFATVHFLFDIHSLISQSQIGCFFI